MFAITKEKLDNWFTYHAPTSKHQEALIEVRSKAREFAQVIVENSLPGADQTAALRKLRECVMTVNASIVLDGE